MIASEGPILGVKGDLSNLTDFGLTVSKILPLEWEAFGDHDGTGFDRFPSTVVDLDRFESDVKDRRIEKRRYWVICCWGVHLPSIWTSVLHWDNTEVSDREPVQLIFHCCTYGMKWRHLFATLDTLITLPKRSKRLERLGKRAGCAFRGAHRVFR